MGKLIPLQNSMIGALVQGIVDYFQEKIDLHRSHPENQRFCTATRAKSEVTNRFIEFSPKHQQTLWFGFIKVNLSFLPKA
jgi:hypothetical protein